MFWNNARQPFESKIFLSQLILLRIGVVVVIYLILSLWISLVTMAFRVDFAQWYGKAGFPLFWISNFMTMWAVSLPLSADCNVCERSLTLYMTRAARYADGNCPVIPWASVYRLLVSSGPPACAHGRPGSPN